MQQSERFSPHHRATRDVRPPSPLGDDGASFNEGGLLLPNGSLILPEDNPLFDPRAERRRLVEEWKSAPAQYIQYDAGTVYNPDGSRAYDYYPGTILVIKDEHVMSTCEYPWSQATINLAFEQLEQRRPRTERAPIKVLEFGFGMNITANRVIERLIGTGRGEYHAVELNTDVYGQAKKWKARKLKEIDRLGEGIPGSKPNIGIQIYHGDAEEIAEQLVENGQRFDIIISDTYPLEPNEQGLNDLRNLSSIVRLSHPWSVFGFFPYVPGSEVRSEGRMTHQQYEAIAPFFDNVVLRKTNVFPSPLYNYLYKNGLWISRLPVAVCTDPVQSLAA